MPIYLRGKAAVVDSVIEPATVDDEQGGFGRIAGNMLRYHRLCIPLSEIWPDDVGLPRD